MPSRLTKQNHSLLRQASVESQAATLLLSFFIFELLVPRVYKSVYLALLSFCSPFYPLMKSRRQKKTEREREREREREKEREERCAFPSLLTQMTKHAVLHLSGSERSQRGGYASRIQLRQSTVDNKLTGQAAGEVIITRAWQ